MPLNKKTTSQGDIVLEVKSTNLQPYYTRTLEIDNTRTAEVNAQVPLRINTQELIESGKLDANCEFLSIAQDGETLPSYVETGCNTPRTLIWTYLETLPADGISLELQYSSLSAVTKPVFEGFYAQALPGINLTNRLSSEVALQTIRPETITSTILNAGSNTADFTGNAQIKLDDSNLPDFVFTDDESQPLITPHISTQETGYTVFSVINNSQPEREGNETILGFERECLNRWCDRRDSNEYYGTSAILTNKNEYRETEVAGKNHKTHYREKIRGFAENERTLVINHTPPGRKTLTYFNQESQHRKRQVLKEHSYQTTNLIVGGINDENTTPFSGGLSEVIVADAALTPEEVQTVREYLMRLYHIQDYQYEITLGAEVSRLDGTIGDRDLTGVPIDEETTLFTVTDIDIQNRQITLYNGIDPGKSFPSSSLSINALLVATTNQTTDEEETQLAEAGDIQVNLGDTNTESSLQFRTDDNELDVSENQTVNPAPLTPANNGAEFNPPESQADQQSSSDSESSEEAIAVTPTDSFSNKEAISPSQLDVICETDLIAGDSPACDITLAEGDFADHSGSVEINVEETETTEQFEFPENGNTYSVLLDPVFETGNYTLNATLVDDVNQTSLSLEQLSVSIAENTTEEDLIIVPPILDSVATPTIEAVAVAEASPWNTQNMAILTTIVVSLIIVTLGLGVAFTSKSQVELAPIKQGPKPYQQVAYLGGNQPDMHGPMQAQQPQQSVQQPPQSFQRPAAQINQYTTPIQGPQVTNPQSPQTGQK
jgi:hypothetical protein